MENFKEHLIKMAQNKHGTIYPCTIGHSWHDAFTVWENYLLFWYNTADNSTHLETIEIEEVEL